MNLDIYVTLVTFLTRKYDHVQMSQLDDWKIKSFILGLKSGLS